GEEAARLALRTQQVLAHESGVADTADPLAGSWFVESLTQELTSRARALLDRVEAVGGMLEAIRSGFVQDAIHRAAYRWQREVESGERVIVGVNQFAEEAPPPAPPFRPDPSVERERAAFLGAWRSGRAAAPVQEALAGLGRAARG